MKNKFSLIRFLGVLVLVFSLWAPRAEADPRPPYQSGDFAYMVEVDYETLVHPIDYVERHLSSVTIEGGGVRVILNYNDLRAGLLGVLPLPEGNWSTAEAKKGCANLLRVEQGSYSNNTGSVEVTRSQVWKSVDPSGNTRLTFLFNVKFGYTYLGGTGVVIFKPEFLATCPGEVKTSPPITTEGTPLEEEVPDPLPLEEEIVLDPRDTSPRRENIPGADGSGLPSSGDGVRGSPVLGAGAFSSDSVSESGEHTATSGSSCSMLGVSGVLDFGTILGIPFALLPLALRRKIK